MTPQTSFTILTFRCLPVNLQPHFWPPTPHSQRRLIRTKTTRPELRKLQGKFLLPRKSARTAAVETLLRSSNMFNTIYLSGKSIKARAWLDAIPKSEAQTMLTSEF